MAQALLPVIHNICTIRLLHLIHSHSTFAYFKHNKDPLSNYGFIDSKNNKAFVLVHLYKAPRLLLHNINRYPFEQPFQIIFYIYIQSSLIQPQKIYPTTVPEGQNLSTKPDTPIPHPQKKKKNIYPPLQNPLLL